MTTAAAARNAIVRGERIANRSPGGGRSYAAVRGLLNYLAFGRYADHLGRSPAQRSPWLDHNEQKQSHEEVLGWAKEKVHRYGYGYTYQLLLSTRDGGLETADYNRVLTEGSALSGMGEWIYTVHEDTDHQHAHAVLFRKEKLSGEQYRKWQAAMQEGLEQALATQARFREAGFYEARRKQELEEALEGTAEDAPAGVSEPGTQQVEQEAGRGRGWGAAL
jgi:hypothetical protein